MTEQSKQTQPTFDQMFQDMVNRINSYGVSFQTAIGLIAAVDNQIKMQLAEKIKEQSIIDNWAKQKSTIGKQQKNDDVPLVPVKEEN
jgi:DNA replication initiation complex subunit (GINS family)